MRAFCPPSFVQPQINEDSMASADQLRAEVQRLRNEIRALEGNVQCGIRRAAQLMAPTLCYFVRWCGTARISTRDGCGAPYGTLRFKPRLHIIGRVRICT